MPGNTVANVMEICKRVLKIVAFCSPIRFHVSLASVPISYTMCAPLTDMCALCSSLRVPERRLMRDLHRSTDDQLIGSFFSDSTHSTVSLFMSFPSIVGFHVLVLLSSCRPCGWLFPHHEDPNRSKQHLCSHPCRIRCNMGPMAGCTIRFGYIDSALKRCAMFSVH